MSGHITDVGRKVLEYCKKYSTLTPTEIAKILHREQKKLFPNVENARRMVRYYTNRSGDVDRRRPKETVALADNSYAPKILLFDIETSPNLAYVWGCWQQNVAPTQLVKHTDVLCYSAKWLGDSMVYFDSRQKDKSDKRLSQTLWELIDQADIVIAHNIKKFDIKVMNTRWLANGLTPPSPYKMIDTLAIAQKEFRFPMNKLDYLARYLGIGCKTEHEGFPLWTKCMDGDRKAWKTMEEYNINDVVLLEDIYLKLRAWDKQHPNVGIMYQDGQERCVCCGSTSLKHINKTSYTSVSYFDSYRCRVCNKVMRSGQRLNKPGKGNKKTIMRNSL